MLNSSGLHHAARERGELHTGGSVAAGLIRTPFQVRARLDRLDVREPLYATPRRRAANPPHSSPRRWLVLHRQLIREDVALKNEIVQAARSREPLEQSRQDAIAEIRNVVLRYA